MSSANGSKPSTTGLVTVSPDERALFKKKRKDLELTQRQLAAKVDVTSGTISNLENGKHTQIERATYFQLRRVLLRQSTADNDGVDAFIHDIIPGLETLDADGRDLIKTMVDKLKKPR